MGTVTIETGHNSDEVKAWTGELYGMYTSWLSANGFGHTRYPNEHGKGVKISFEVDDEALRILRGESGVHRTVRTWPWDDRRVTSFALVKVEGDKLPNEDEWGIQKRSYILDPYELCKDHQLEMETDRVADVLNGRLEILREQ